MLRQIEGSRAIAESVALCRPHVICAYPITPQTHIVEELSALVKTGALEGCEFINVESEFAALSVAIGASATGARSYTATSSQGLLFMCEAVYNAAGMALPIVMTLGNRAIGAPINIWNDHSDAMALRDAGWIMIFAEDNQEAVDLHIQAFKLAEEFSTPVMVCVDGFILTHAYEQVEIPTQQQVDRYLPAFIPKQNLDPDDPVTMGALVGPESFSEVRYLAHHKQLRALARIPSLSVEFAIHFGREAGGILRTYKADDATTLIFAMGSVCGTIKDAIDELREEGHSIGLVILTTFRPFPFEAVQKALAGAAKIMVVEKSLTAGMGGPLAADVRLAVQGNRAQNTTGKPGTETADGQKVYSAIAGLGGRAITKDALTALFKRMASDELPETTFVNLNWDLVNKIISENGNPVIAQPAG
jgi:pyruvate ferredoxin oxidoreductase alpha subunit